MTQDWQAIRAHRFAPDAPPPEWPHGVRPISLTGTCLLGIDERTGRLYWDGHELATVRRLDRPERILAGLATAAAVTVALVEVGRSLGWWGG